MSLRIERPVLFQYKKESPNRTALILGKPVAQAKSVAVVKLIARPKAARSNKPVRRTDLPHSFTRYHIGAETLVRFAVYTGPTRKT